MRSGGNARLNQAVKRNSERFPEDFRFQLTGAEVAASRSQFVTLKPGRGSNIKFQPYAFTEHGAIQAANVLNSPRAVAMGVYVVRAFVLPIPGRLPARNARGTGRATAG
jgi:hypothetical protein